MEVAKQGQTDFDSSVCGPNRGPRGLISLDRAIIRVEGYGGIHSTCRLTAWVLKHVNVFIGARDTTNVHLRARWYLWLP